MDLEKDFLYVTVFENKSPSAWRIFEREREIALLGPGEKWKVESWHNRTDWARWSKCVREKDGNISVTENPSWQCPWSEYHLLEAYNKDGSAVESIRVFSPNPILGTSVSDFVHVQRGIPLLIPLRVEDPLIKWERIEWRRQTVRKKIEGTRYFTSSEEVVKVCTPRSKSELKAVLKERAEIEEARIREEREKVIAEQEKILMAEEPPNA